MIKRIGFVLFILSSFFTAWAQQKVMVNGMTIGKTMTIKRGVYRIDANKNQDQPLIIIEGNNITIDFNQAELKGSNTISNPDVFFGVAILIQNSKNITIKNLRANGYKIALLAKNVAKLTLDNCDLSYNYRQHLNSTSEKEDVADWMSYHHNEKDEWLRYGAAMYLRNCQFAVIRNCKVTGGQNALMMMECNDGLIYNNDFSFNSGIGLGMYRCNRNKVMYNKINFNIRGYSDGVYNRGQDSAGILVYEQSNENLFYKNNVTHGGDGLFLWAGQTTMDSGEGGCNDNIISDNDFSYASNNGIEATFSRNHITQNKIMECDYGIWGGYSYESTICNNWFWKNKTAIAIEHGQKNKIIYNRFSRNGLVLKLWGKKEQEVDWGYVKNRDTRSRDYLIAYNHIDNCSLVYNMELTDSIKLCDMVQESGPIFKMDSTVTNLDTGCNVKSFNIIVDDTAKLSIDKIKHRDPFKDTKSYDGRKNIIITEWGPYDFRSPIIWNNNPTDTSNLMKFDLLGPKGKWKIKSSRGVENISAMSGEFPSSIVAQKIRGSRTDILIELEYTGSPIITPFGEAIAAGKPYQFSFKKFFQPIDWEVLFYPLDTAKYNPIQTGVLFPRSGKRVPFKTENINKLDYAWWGGIKADYQHTQFITVANAEVVIPEGDYELSVTWDDAVRVYIDQKLVIDEWDPSRYDFNESPHKRIRISLGGTYHFLVEHLELGGFAALSLKLKPIE